MRSIRKKLLDLCLWVYRLQWTEVQALAALVQRTMSFSITINGNAAYIAAELGQTEISWVVLKSGPDELHRG